MKAKCHLDHFLKAEKLCLIENMLDRNEKSEKVLEKTQNSLIYRTNKYQPQWGIWMGWIHFDDVYWLWM